MTTCGAPTSTPGHWRAAARARRAASAETLRLPSGATIRAVRPSPLEWILTGRVPQRLLSAALAADGAGPAATDGELSREDVLEFARFAADLVRASVVEPPIGPGPGEMRFEDIPVEDSAFIFEWACRSLRDAADNSGKEASNPSADGLERFCAK